MRIHGVAMPEAFKIANGVMKDAVSGIAEIVNVPGLIGVDFADVYTVMSEKGNAMLGSAIASGPDRGKIAAERAIASPLFANMNLSDALGVLVNITSTSSIKLKELDDVMGCVQFASEDACVIVGAIFDETMGDDMRVTVVATGLGLPESAYSERRAANLARNKEIEAIRTFAAENGGYDIPSFLRKSQPCGFEV
jgi:cell division protein FtsZ